MTSASAIATFPSHDGLLAYRDTGSGLPVVLLHASFLDHTMFDELVPALAGRHRVIAPDVRGHGRSANATLPFRQTDDLAALLRHLDTGPAVLVGTSMGANIAVDTALEHPDLVRALVISGGGTGLSEFRDPWLLELGAEKDAAMAAGDIAGWVDGFARIAAGPHRSLDEVDPEVVRRVKEMVWRTLAKHTADEQDHSVAVADTAARAKEIAVPVLALNGALDSPELIAIAEDLAAAVPDGRTVALEGAAHLPSMDRPEAFLRAVEGFLQEIAG
ncbi:alpha/beta fold hydrolase [Kitasatospora sp. DSM 101779]|uniref:alpha/beta fold hydrolase n=1 Tax=Kitasatospora sp. DSM 101779 TaxID=2853165 RepID=UPI0021D933FE|nr:alpha/beta hydrolase [Kitasatospora sp. DSM 101779]MCU7821394.1 alpha/beta hydrolase [Kitasatospora sp. DSM 101779]